MPKSGVCKNVSNHQHAGEPTFLQQQVDTYFGDRQAEWGGQHLLIGGRPKNEDIVLQSNDYLAIAGHEKIAAAQIACLQRLSGGALMSAVYLHKDSPQGQLEHRLASHMGKEDAVLCQSGYAANVGLLQAIASSDTPIYIDMSAHASLWEGARSAAAEAVPFRHNNINHLEHRVKRHGAGIIVVDSVYSTTGHVAPLAELVDVAERYGCVTVVDESHSLGTHGHRGAGMVADLGLTERVHFVTASLAKTFAGRAGVIGCSRRLAEYITFHSFPAIFSSALLPQELAGLDATLDIVRGAHNQRVHLRAVSTRLRSGLDSLGYNVDMSEAQIIGLESGQEPVTMVLRDTLESRGVFGSVFCAPATAKNRSLVRLSINAGLSFGDIDFMLGVFKDIRDAVGLEDWASTRRRQGLQNRPSRLVA